MSWNYRVIEFVEPDGEPYFEIHEVFYNKEFQPDGYSEMHAAVCSESLAGLPKVLEMFKSALSKPVLREKDFITGRIMEDDNETTL